MENIIYIILVVLLILILVVFSKYNKLITLLNRIKNDKANIDILMKKRFDLIPNLVSCIKSYSKYEKGTLEDIVSLRNSYNKKDKINVKESGEIDNKLSKYLLLVEAYPNLKANEEYMSLQRELSTIENELVGQRYVYNNDVTRYNTAIEKVPSNVVALIFGFKKAELFQIKDIEKENIDIKL